MSKQRRTLIFYFLLVYLIAGSAATTVSVLVYRLVLKEEFIKIQSSENVYIKGQITLLAHVVDEVAADLLSLSERNELNRYIARRALEDKRQMAEEFSSLSLEGGRYDQVCLIDVSGKEVIRVNFDGGKAAIAPDEALQNKSDRYYFKNTMRHDKGQIYISPMDLNVEPHGVGTPFEPIVRFCLPIFDAQGKRKGAIVLNFLGSYLIHMLEEVSGISKGKLMIVNSEGFWLHSPKAEDTWGFMVKERAGQTFQKQYPDVWTRLSREGFSQVPYRGGLFTCGTVFPEKLPIAGKGHPPEDRPIAWKIISYVPAGAIAASVADFRIHLIRYNTIILILLIVPVFMYVRLIYKRRRLQEALVRSANFDALTGLPNRPMFFGVLEQAILHARRYRQNFALLFIDIDGFKSVNDTLGHGNGDKLLVAIAERFREVLRESDTVARLGGDEFIVLLNRINTRADAERVAAKLIATVSRPFALPSDGDRPHKARIGASIGISTYPVNGTTSDLLVKKADHAMYRCKRQGKNAYGLSALGDAEDLSS